MNEEFSRATEQALVALIPLMPRATLCRQLVDPKTEFLRMPMCGYMLGLCGNADGTRRKQSHKADRVLHRDPLGPGFWDGDARLLGRRGPAKQCSKNRCRHNNAWREPFGGHRAVSRSEAQGLASRRRIATIGIWLQLRCRDIHAALKQHAGAISNPSESCSAGWLFAPGI